MRPPGESRRGPPTLQIRAKALLPLILWSGYGSFIHVAGSPAQRKGANGSKPHSSTDGIGQAILGIPPASVPYCSFRPKRARRRHVDCSGASMMDRSRGAGGYPPQSRHARAGNAGAEPMVTVRSRIIQFGFILCLFAVLVAGTSLEAQQAMARPASLGGSDGTPYGTGDPTGDDLPSPTPKPGSVQTVSRTASMSGTVVRGSTYGSSNRWNIYLSILLRLGLR